jgi:hypothetical protein
LHTNLPQGCVSTLCAVFRVVPRGEATDGGSSRQPCVPRSLGRQARCWLLAAGAGGTATLPLSRTIGHICNAVVKSRLERGAVTTDGVYTGSTSRRASGTRSGIDGARHRRPSPSSRRCVRSVGSTRRRLAKVLVVGHIISPPTACLSRRGRTGEREDKHRYDSATVAANIDRYKYIFIYVYPYISPYFIEPAIVGRASSESIASSSLVR